MLKLLQHTLAYAAYAKLCKRQQDSHARPHAMRELEARQEHRHLWHGFELVFEHAPPFGVAQVTRQ